MAAYDFDAPRLFVEASLARDARLTLERAQAHYLLSVLRLRHGDEVLVFNGRDGEWRARIELNGRKTGSLDAVEQLRAQPAAPDLLLLFAPLKHARLDYAVQKAVEMGVGRLRPVLTKRTAVARVNLDRMRANVVEAAEQCGILCIPEVLPAADLPAALRELEPGRSLAFCDEDAPVADPFRALAGAGAAGGLALLIGPEGGFAPEERTAILAHPNVLRLSLGPRILRADTAAVASLALLQAALGDWR